MKKNKQDKKRIIAAVVAIFLALLMVFSALAPFVMGATGSVTINAEVGYAGYYKVGYPSPVVVDIENNGDALKGEILIKILSSNEYDSKKTYITYAYPVEIPQNGSKTIEMDITINRILTAGELKVELVSDKNKAIALKHVSAAAVDPETLMVASLTDNPGNLSYIRAMYAEEFLANVGNKVNKIINFDSNSFPKTLESLGTFNVLYINNFDTTRLTNIQLEALKGWVNNGGVLFVGTGENFDKVTGGLTDIIDIKDSGQTKTDDLDFVFANIDEGFVYGEYTPPPYKEIEEEIPAESEENITDDQAEIQDEEESQSEDEGEALGTDSQAEPPLKRPNVAMAQAVKEYELVNVTLTNIYGFESVSAAPIVFNAFELVGSSFPENVVNEFTMSKMITIGSGKVVVTAFDFGSDIVSKSVRFSEYVKNLALTTIDQSMLYYSNNANTTVIYPGNLSSIPAQSQSMVTIILVIVFIYIIVIGPILYLILKKRDKREAGFVIIPITAGVLTMLIYGLSFNTMYKKPIINSASKITVYNGSNIGTQLSNIGVLTAKKGNVTMQMDTGTSMPSVNVNNYNSYYGYYGSSDTKDLKITYGSKPQLIFYDNASWKTNIFSMAEEVDLLGAIDVDVYVENGIFKGTIANNTAYNLSELAVSFGLAGYYNYGALERGQTIDVNTSENELLENNSYYYNYGGYNRLGSEEKLDSYDRWQYGMRRNMIENLNNSYYNSYSSKYNNSYSWDMSNNSRIEITAFTDENIGGFSATMNGKTPVTFTTNLIYMEHECETRYTDNFDLPFGYIRFSGIISEDFFDYGSYNYLYVYEAEELEFIFSFPLYEQVSLFQFDEDLKENQYGAAVSATIYNCDTEKWEQLTYKEYTKNPRRYFNDSGELRIKVNCANADEIDVPKIRIKGGL